VAGIQPTWLRIAIGPEHYLGHYPVRHRSHTLRRTVKEYYNIKLLFFALLIWSIVSIFVTYMEF